MRKNLTIPISLLCLTSTPLAVLRAADASKPATRPNILWLVVDDMSANFSCYGETLIQTPHVDRLACTGTRFVNACAGVLAVRLGHFKLVRQGLKTNSPGGWEVYDPSKDLAEAHDSAASHAELIQQAEEVLRREVDENKVFPLTIPGVNTAAR